MVSDDLLSFIESVSGDRHLAVEENLGDGFVRLKTAEAERRQARHDIRCVEDIVIEMLRNSRDAHAHDVYVATSREGTVKRLVVIDDGDGVPEDMQGAIFEPRVTSKLETMVMDAWGVHGRGMALYAIKENALHAQIVSSAPSMGADFVVDIDLNALPEKVDQSTSPVIAKDEDGAFVVASGPHNIIRTVVEFALDVQDKMNVYLGSPAEIAATLIRTGKQGLVDAHLLFCEDMYKIPVTSRPAAASDAAELSEICNALGLEMSERTAHRVFSGDVAPLRPVLDELLPRDEAGRSLEGAPDIYKDRRGFKVSEEDLAAFSQKLSASFSELANRYYIELTDDPIIRVGKDTITVKFPFEKEL